MSETKRKVGHQEKDKAISGHQLCQRGIHDEKESWVESWRIVSTKATQGHVLTGKVLCIDPLQDSKAQEFSSVFLF